MPHTYRYLIEIKDAETDAVVILSGRRLEHQVHPPRRGLSDNMR